LLRTADPDCAGGERQHEPCKRPNELPDLQVHLLIRVLASLFARLAPLAQAEICFSSACSSLHRRIIGGIHEDGVDLRHELAIGL
jgi:hypothetical protein